MKIVVTYILLLAAGVSVFAQTTVESIREEYREIHEMIELMTLDSEGFSAMPPSYYEVTKVQNLPATGMHREVVRMYYGELPSEEEGDPYPPHYLRFVTSRYNYAAREFYEEYLFDSKGDLIFLYAITPDIYLDRLTHFELRLWLSPEAGILRFTAKEAQGDEKYEGNLGAFNYKEVYSGREIPEVYRDEVDLRLQRAKGFLSMFKGIDEN